MNKWMRLTAAATMLATALPMSAWAKANDNEFRLVTPEVRQGSGTVIAVRLVNKATEHPVSGAIIFATRLDMGPDNMPTMTAPLTPVPGAEPGVYRFRAEGLMGGRWALSLTAKVQGEDGTLQSRLLLRVVP